MSFDLYNQTPASNDQVNYFQTGMRPSAVKIAGWDIMADLAQFMSLPTSAGSANAQTVTNTRTQPVNFKGQWCCFIPGFTNTGAVTVAQDGATALNVFANGVAALAGMIVLNVPAIMRNDGTQWNLINPQRSTGSVTGTPTGFSGSPGTCTLTYSVAPDGHTVNVNVTTGINGTSNATAFTITGLPAALASTITQQSFPTYIRDNAAMGNGGIQMNSGSATITLSNGTQFLATNFTASSTKGFPIGGAVSFSYQL